MMFEKALELWILLCAGLAFAGWTFSAFSILGAPAYAAFFVVFFLLITVFRNELGLPEVKPGLAFRKISRRFRRLPAFLFLCIVIFSFAGSMAYPTIHFDSLSYRLPRALHWMAEGHWHWIHTPDNRMNVVGASTEWLWTPIMLLTDSERILSVTNLVSYCFLPGLLYSFFIRVRIKRRLAWWWMWLLPAAYCYALQAGSLGTDGYAAVFTLASVVYAFKAAEKRSLYYFSVSIFAIAFATGTKQTILIAVPLWFLAALPALPVCLRRPIVTVAVVVVALMASFLPSAVQNITYTGGWNGFEIEPQSKFWSIIGNSFAIPLENLLPPVFPPARKWNAAMLEFVETPFGSHFNKFEHFALLYRGPNENSGGLGLTTCALLLLSLASLRPRTVAPPKGSSWEKYVVPAILIAPWLLVIVYMGTVTIAKAARYLAFFYPFLFAGILYLCDRPYRHRWWRFAAYASLITTLGTLALLRQRPLFPVPLVATAVEKVVSKNFADRVRSAFSFVPDVRNTIDSFHSALPPQTKVAAYISEVGNLELPLWHPYGSRRVWRYGAQDAPDLTDEIREKKIEYAILDQNALTPSGTKLEDWLKKHHAEVVFTRGMLPEPDMPPKQSWLVKFNQSTL